MTKEQFTQAVLDAEVSLYRTAKSILLNDEDCADAIQNAICQAYAKIDTLKQDKFFKTWITRILINECYQYLRKKAKEQEVPFEEYMVERQTSESDSEIYQMIAELEDKYRVPFVLHYIEGYSVKEIAQILSISTGNVKVRLFRARNDLQILLKGENAI